MRSVLASRLSLSEPPQGGQTAGRYTAPQVYTRRPARGRGEAPPDGLGRAAPSPPHTTRDRTRGPTGHTTGTGDHRPHEDRGPPPGPGTKNTTRGNRPEDTPHRGNKGRAPGYDLMAATRPPLTVLERRAATLPRLGERLGACLCGRLHLLILGEVEVGVREAVTNWAAVLLVTRWVVGDQPTFVRPTNPLWTLVGRQDPPTNWWVTNWLVGQEHCLPFLDTHVHQR